MQKFSKLRLIGLSKPESVKVRLDFDPVVSTLTIAASYNQLVWQLDYEAQGTVVLLPLNAVTLVEFIVGEC